PEHGSDAQGPEPALRASLPRRGKVGDQLEPLVGGDARFRATGLRLQARFPERLPDVEGDGPRQLLLALREHGPDPAHEPGAIVQGELRELLLCHPRSSYRSIDLRLRTGIPYD